MKLAAKDLHKLGPKYVLVKGGHLVSISDGSKPEDSEVVDVFYDGTEILLLKQPTVPTTNTHGTGKGQIQLVSLTPLLLPCNSACTVMITMRIRETVEKV